MASRLRDLLTAAPAERMHTSNRIDVHVAATPGGN
jgi:hypothetical protein